MYIMTINADSAVCIGPTSISFHLPTWTWRYAIIYNRFIINSQWFFVQLLRNAGRRFVGEHDFRNFCKVSFQLYYNLLLLPLWYQMDVKSGLKNPVRRILSVEIDKVENRYREL